MSMADKTLIRRKGAFHAQGRNEKRKHTADVARSGKRQKQAAGTAEASDGIFSDEEPSSAEDGEKCDSDEGKDKEDKWPSLKDWLLDLQERKGAGPFQAYKQAAQWLMHTVDMFGNYCQAVVVHACILKKRYVDLATKKTVPKTKFYEMYARERKLIDALHNSVPDFDNDFDTIRGKSILVSRFGQKLNVAAGQAQTWDIKSLRVAEILYVKSKMKAWFDEYGTTFPLDPTRRKEVARGPRHPLLQLLMLPPHLSEESRKDWEGVRDKLLNQKLRLVGNKFPSFLYADLEYDPDNMQNGLLCSKLILMFWKHVFTSPSSVSNEEKKVKVKRNQAELNEMEHVTAESIAYICTWWMLSDLDDWRIDDVFDRELFYKTLLGLFIVDGIDPTESVNEWIKDTLAWWNSHTFGIEPEETEFVEPNPVSTLDLIRQQRKAKNCAKSQAGHLSAATLVATK
ncbi:hypothetical protein H1R20_g6331, partial [Candolleomyces eurysporus]